jgi:hypothetical protein
VSSDTGNQKTVEENLMVMIGIDAHNKTFTAVAVDERGRQVWAEDPEVDQRRMLASSSVRWALQWPDRQFEVEDCRHLI